jgi:XAP5, circadian clock regulator
MEPTAMLKMTTIFQAWEEKQKSLKAEDIEITYSYWDGSGKASLLLAL